MLLKLRSDLKDAMKSKDTTRLNVLRALLADTTNAAKTPHPIKTNIQLLRLLRKRAEESKGAASEFGAAKRQDLQKKEEDKLTVLEGYAAGMGIETVSDSEVTQAIESAIDALNTDGQRVDAGKVMAKLFKTGGFLDGKEADQRSIMEAVKKIQGQRKDHMAV
ncbi:MAG: hypothetical protein M1814_004322 [Vezdaea aestivalis]|nr:MAG: hypothetical protein M1814_004322 [Vezdaea aestivalis]